ncbi:DNA (cytosine-5)-methyltransferase 3C-like [Thrips palmi]|uniref:DNA (cytosine-5-)-methyltransferase n=1 Tax=Thrips palmi TaxID=161013 RepID=A0A6P8Y868_THRPL|nr:DNA (cytosine-5)-methyltransferase 3C-like [Thrips palmi]
MARERKYKKRKRGYRKHFSKPKKGCKPYKGLVKADEDGFIEGFCGFENPPLPAIRVLSLFDGIGSALVALDKLNLDVEAFYSSEIDEKAIKLLRFHYHDRIKMLGPVQNLTEGKLASLGVINLLCGGSPCAELSLVNPARKGLNDPSSSGHLFFEYHRILQYLTKSAKEKGHQFYWMFENTSSMELGTKQQMSSYLQCSPVVRCASQFVPMKRKRFFWGNFPSQSIEESDRDGINLQYFLKPYREATVHSMPTLTTNSHSQRSGREQCLPVTEEGVPSHLYITEQEQLFGFPSHYTDGPNLSVTDRRKLLGKAWCIPVVVDLLKFLCPLFKTKLQSKADISPT